MRPRDDRPGDDEVEERDGLDAASPDAGSWSEASVTGPAGAAPRPDEPGSPPPPVLRMSIVDGLRRLLKPRHIAAAGGRTSEVVIRECRRIGFEGPIWPLHPQRAEVGGLKAFRSVADLPEAPDATFIGTPVAPTIDIVGSLAARGAGAAVCYAAGFAEIGGEGALLQRRLVEAAAG